MLEKEDTTHLEFIESSGITLTDVFKYESTQFNMNIMFYPKDWKDENHEGFYVFGFAKITQIMPPLHFAHRYPHE